MGECLLLRRGGDVKRLPTLNANYPADAAVWIGDPATFKIEIAEAGVPDEYTYQWYRNSTEIANATAATLTLTGLNSEQTASIYCIITNKAGFVQSRTATLTVRKTTPAFSFAGGCELIDEGSDNWHIKFTGSGALKFSGWGKWDGKADIFILGGGGAGANTGGVAVGGGGYYTTVMGQQLALNTNYDAIIGGGGNSAGSKGGTSSIAGKSANGGEAAVAGTTGYASCQVSGTTGTAGNVYHYASLSAAAVSIGSGYKTVDLVYPLTTGTHTNGTVLYKGTSGWYRCIVNSIGTIYYDPGVNGAGAAATRIFGTGDTVSGPGETGDASRLGQGGGTSGIKGGNGVIVIRNSR